MSSGTWPYDTRQFFSGYQLKFEAFHTRFNEVTVVDRNRECEARASARRALIKSHLGGYTQRRQMGGTDSYSRCYLDKIYTSCLSPHCFIAHEGI